ncbi:aromatic ring-opening dioxygenase LigA [Novosphingobium malaysiense]|uniref:Aromatic ring-opening dioxygenase LigA n=1 Tax=Novosphingobium malaysiense TaxID=1348853 RepID=A0A0B1ZFH7_9SPHN|nr:aromatic ring-opening dioxygenase LigA [Novosphingobium malaysiense]
MERQSTPVRQPAFFITHGGGPCFFMPDTGGVWTQLAAHLRAISPALPQTPRALLVVSAHWETAGFAVSGCDRPGLLYDYHGFPPETYALTWPAAGDPDLAQRAVEMLDVSGLTASIDCVRGWDHGVFVPMKVAFPDADIPCLAMSLDRSLDPDLHLRAGRALAPLRDEGVVIVGSGSSFHNMRAMADSALAQCSIDFDAWLHDAVTSQPDRRDVALRNWERAPNARISHPREEHLLPLMVAAGTSDLPGTVIYREKLAGRVALSGFRFD